MKNFTLTHETPAHFVVHNGVSHFHIAQNGIDRPTADKIRALAKGGVIKSQQTPEEAGIEAQAQREADLKQQSPQEKQIESQAQQQDPSDYVKQNNPDKFAAGGKVQHYDEGTPDEPVTNIDPDKAKSISDSFKGALGF